MNADKKKLPKIEKCSKCRFKAWLFSKRFQDEKKISYKYHVECCNCNNQGKSNIDRRIAILGWNKDQRRERREQG